MPAAVRTGAALLGLIRAACNARGMAPADCEAVAATAVDLILGEYGGRRLYIPMHEMSRQARDEAIARNVAAGMSVKRLAVRYCLGTDRIRQIVRKEQGKSTTSIAP